MPTSRACLFGLLFLAAPLAAQALAQEGSATTTVLELAKTAYNQFNYGRADSLTKTLLAMPTLTARQRIAALQLRAAALYPDPQEGGVRDRDGAMGALTEFVKLTFDQPILREYRSPGLDSLLVQARSSTFAARATPDREYAMVGLEGTAQIPVRSTRRAVFRLVYLGGDGAILPIDSIGPDTSGSLTIQGMIDTAPALPQGAGEMQVTATDVLSEESVIQRFPVRVKSPALPLVSAPTALTATDFKPERKRPSRIKGIVLGVLVGGATIAVSTAARGPEDLKDAFDPDSRATAIGIGLGAAVIAAGFLDPGTRIPDNARANEELRTRWNQDVEAVRAQNVRLLAAYRQTITFETEAP
jgi:hypothetical protein